MVEDLEYLDELDDDESLERRIIYDEYDEDTSYGSKIYQLNYIYKNSFY